MCVNPRILANGVPVACRKCWQCRQNRINDWVGRCIAEGRTSVAAHSVTLTYGPDADGRSDHERAAVLTYSDVQKYFKRLRKDGYPLRYFCVGEFGGAKGRAHWHLILFWQKKVPKHEVAKRFNCEHWVHGFSFWDEVNAGSIRYVCKYIQKDLRDAERQRQVSMSKYPPLGAGYFARLSGRYAEQGIAPRQPSYSFPDVVDVKGEIIEFRLAGRSLDLFCEAYLNHWERLHGGHPPASELLSAYWDRVAPPSIELRPAPHRRLSERPWIVPPGRFMTFSERHNSWCCDYDGQTLFWSYDLQGNRAWQNVIRTEAQADLLREAYERRKLLPSYLEASRGDGGRPIRSKR